MYVKVNVKVNEQVNEQDLKEFNEKLQKMITIQDEAIERYWNALNEIEHLAKQGLFDTEEYLKIINKAKEGEPCNKLQN